MKSFFYSAYPDYSTITHRLARNTLAFPHIFAQKFGTSVWGKPLQCVKVGSGSTCLMVVGGTHATEYMGVLSCMAFLEHLLQSRDPYTKAALQKGSVTIVPCLNPDGLTLWLDGIFAAPDPAAIYDMCGGDLSHWQANGSGVDLNRNFDAGFYQGIDLAAQNGFTAPGPTRYGGVKPFDQPETAALRDLCLADRPNCMVCLHSQGEEIYHQYIPHLPQSDTAAKILHLLSGYRICDPDPIAAHGGCKDWFIKTFHKPGFTIEQGKGKNPLPLADFDKIWQKTLPMLLALLYLSV